VACIQQAGLCTLHINPDEQNEIVDALLSGHLSAVDSGAPIRFQRVKSPYDTFLSKNLKNACNVRGVIVRSALSVRMNLLIFRASKMFLSYTIADFKIVICSIFLILEAN